MHPSPQHDLADAAVLIEAVRFGDATIRNRVLVFRTSVSDNRRIAALKTVLDGLVGGTGRWTFDLEDRDHVLRIESDRATHAQVIRILEEHGELCSELD